MARSFLALALFTLVATTATAVRAEEEKCANPKGALGVSRIIEIDTKAGPLFGEFTKYEKEPRFLGPKEVVLTFDDGPLPRYTKPILKALDKFCTKATFFYVGKMAMAYPDMVKEVIGRGHTMGTHTWSHPMNLRRRGLKTAQDQIERGFAAVAMAAGEPIAPFFRFPGLSDSPGMLNYLQERGVAAFTVDVVSNDSYISSSSHLVRRTLAQIERQNGGIVLFHDIKSSTARALPTILAALKKRGYKIVHLRAKSTFEPLPDLTAELEKKYPKAAGKTAKADDGDDAGDEKKERKLKPFYAAIEPSTLAEEGETEPAVTELAPEARERTKPRKSSKDDSASVEDEEKPAAKVRRSYKSKAKRTTSKTSSNEPIMSISAAVSGRY